MTAEIINLRQARKARKRAAAQAGAQENRARFGTSKAERQRLSIEADRVIRHLDGARRTTAWDGPAPGDDDPPTGGAA